MVRDINHWEKVLFLPNRKLQTLELNETQDVLRKQITSNFESFYDVNYSVINGFEINYLNFIDDKYIFYISSGLLKYKDNNGISHFLRVKERTISIEKEARSFINLKISEEYITEIKDEIDGSFLFGSIGSDRLSYSISSTINNDGWPLAIIDTFNNIPYIYNFFEKKYERDFLLTRFPQRILDKIYKIFYEQSGNFIANGLELLLDDRPNQIPILKVQEGVAYIDGKRVALNTTKYFRLTETIHPEGTNIYIYLDRRGSVFYRNYLLSNKTRNWFLLGSVSYRGRTRIVNLSKSRKLTNTDIQNIEDLNNKLKIDYQNLALSYRNIGINRVNLLDTFIASFSDLTQSDIYNYLFDCSISNELEYCSLPKQSRIFNLNDLTIIENKNVIKYNNHFIPAFTEFKVLNQSQSTEWIELSINNTKKGNIKITPNFAYPNVDSLEYKVLYEGNSKVLLNALEVEVEGTGFLNESNLSVIFGNVVITDLEVIIGTISNTDNTIIPRNDGYLKIKFKIPNNLDSGNYVVEIKNENISAAAIFRSINKPTISPIESTIDLEVTDTVIAQSFNINSGTIIKGGELFFRTVNNSDVREIIGQIHISPIISNKIQNISIASSYLYATDIKTTSNGSLGSKFNFETPLYLKKGKYAIVFSSYVSNLEIYTATANEFLLSGNSNAIDVIDGNLFTYSNNTWIPQLDKDLTFNLTSFNFTQLDSSISFRLNNPFEEFKVLTSYINYIRPTGTIIEILYKEEGQGNFNTLNPNITFTKNLSYVDIQLRFKSSSYLAPFINDKYYFVTNSFKEKGIWISKTVEMQSYYSEVNLELDLYLPDRSEIDIYISSNNTQTWVKLEKQSEKLINGSIPLYRVKYSKDVGETELFYINNKSTTFKRKNLTIRVDLKSSNISSLPYFRNIIANVL